MDSPLFEIRPLLPSSAPILAEPLTNLINAAYGARSETDLWLTPPTRTSVPVINTMISSSEILGLYLPTDALVGCVRVQLLDPETAHIGYLTVDSEAQGRGAGRFLAEAAEKKARELGCKTMQLDSIMPKEAKCESRERLKAWYERLGYVIVQVAKVDDFVPGLEANLRFECDWLIWQKSLGESE